MKSRGLRVGPVMDGPYGLEATIVDPMGLVMGLRESPPRPTLSVDREALRRRRRGEAFNPGCVPMPANVPELGWIRMRAQDPGALTEFYATRLGLPLIDAHAGSTLLDLGDNLALEIAGGGNRREPPSAQMGALSAAILRVTRLPELIAALTEAGAHFVGGRYSSPKGDWVYIADPEGNVVGLADRRHPGSYCAVLPVAPEDLEAARRAAEAACAPARHDRR
jgi:predicted enzyme related to lactoylglutathione lyase